MTGGSERSFWLLSVTVFALLVCVNYAPAFVGQVPFPKEVVLQFPPWAGFTTESFQSFSDIGDLAVSFYPFRSFGADSMREGILPLWNPYLLSGIPFLANNQSALFYPLHIFYYILSTPIAWALGFFLRMFLSAFFMALLVRSIGASRTGAVLSGIIFASCGFMTAWQGQAMSDAAIWLPLICYAVNRLHQDGARMSIALTAAAFALPVLAGHPETAAHVTLGGCAFALFLLACSFNVRFIGSFALAGFLAMGLAAVQIVPTLEWLGEMERYFGMIWPALAPNQIIGLVARDIMRSPNSAGIWMPEGTAYLGMITLLAASLAPFHKARRYVAFFGAMTLISLGIAYMIEPFYWLASHSPLIGSLKNGRFVLLAAFGFAALAGFGASAIEERVEPRQRRAMLAALSAAFVVSFVLVRQLQAVTTFDVEFMRRPSFSMALLFVGIIPILWKLLGGLRGRAFPVMVLAFAAFDFATFSYGAVGFSRAREIYPAVPLFDFLTKEDPATFRVVELDLSYPANAPMMYGVQSADGYEISLARTQTFWRGLAENRMDGIFLSARGVLASKDRRLDMMNVKYFVVHAEEAVKFENSDRFTQAFNNGYIAVLENKTVLPRAYAVPQAGVEVVYDMGDQLARLGEPSFDPEESVILSEPLPFTARSTIPSPLTSDIRMTTSDSQSVAFHAVTSAPSVLVLSQTYYPGWIATIDGVETPVFPADLALTGIALPAGTHDVRFEFRPASVKVGIAVTLISVLFVGGLAVPIRRYQLPRSQRLEVAARAAVLIVLIGTAAVNVLDVREMLGTEVAAEADEITLYEERLRQLRPFLPDTGEVGYLSDQPPDDAITNPEIVKNFYLAQYALVPVVLRPGADNEFIVGNFLDPAAARLLTSDLTVIKDFGGGLMVLRRPAN